LDHVANTGALAAEFEPPRDSQFAFTLAAKDFNTGDISAY
jgi:hypothetical protein